VWRRSSREFQVDRETDGTKIILKRIADIDLETDRGVKLKAEVLTPRAEDVIKDPEIDIVMELMGGIEPAKNIYSSGDP